MKKLIGCLGFLFLFPFISIGSIKLDDILAICLLFLLVVQNGFHKKALIVLFVGSLFFFWGYSARLIFDVTVFENYAIFRMVQIIIFTMLICYMGRQSRYQLYKGLAIGSIFTSGIVVVSCSIFMLSHGISNIYVLKKHVGELFNLHPNTYGIISLFGSFACYQLYDMSKNNIWLKLAAFILLSPFILLIRRDIVAILVAFVIFIYPFINVTNKIKITFGIMCTIIPYLFFTESGTALYDSLTSVNYATGEGTSYRNLIWAAAFEAIIKNPLGYGFDTEVTLINNFSMLYLDFAAHNSYLSIVIELGFFALFILIGFVVFGYTTAIKYENYILCFFLSLPLISGFAGNGMYLYKYHCIFFMLVIIEIYQLYFNKSES